MSSQWKQEDDREEEEEEETTADFQYKNQKDAILFCINVSESMLSTHEIEEDDGDDPVAKKKTKKRPSSAVRTALEVAYLILQQRIISDPKDMMGILLFGTEETKFPEGAIYEHCYLLMDLDIPDAESIKRLKNILEDEKEFNKIMKPSKKKAAMNNVLFGATQIFTTKAPNFNSRRLFIVTDDDDPHSSDQTVKKSAVTRARDCYDLGIRIEPFYISNPNRKQFDPGLFYEDIIYRSADADDDDAPLHLKPTNDGKLRLREMVEGIRSKTSPKRALFTSRLELGPGVKIGVKGFLLFKRQEPSRACYVYTKGEKAQVAVLETERIAEDTARKVAKQDVLKAYKFGGEQVYFTPEELASMRHFDDPIIRIIGFKPRAALKFEHQVRTSSFIYPDEAEIVGSTRVFAALHKTLLKSDKIGIAWHVPRKNSSPVLVALYPTPEILMDDTQLAPSGIFCIQLPFADDLRQNPPVETKEAPNVLKTAMRAVVKQLHIPRGYIPDKYANPALQWHYRCLQAIALDEDVPSREEREDQTVPKYKLLQKYAGKAIKDWYSVLDEVTHDLVSLSLPDNPRGTKRTSPAEDVKPAKKSRGTGGNEAEDEVSTAVKKGSLNKCTVVTLREFCKLKGLDGSGKKADLVEKVEGWFERKR